MKVIGLTGGIAMGKSTAAKAFRRAGVPVFDSDAAVRALQAPGGRALAAIEAAFPGTVRREARSLSPQGGPPQDRLVLDRVALRRVVLADRSALARLEVIIHPLVRQRERAFLAAARRRGAHLVVLDVPLLFESRGTAGLDLVVVVSAPAAVQRARVRRRGLLSEAQLAAVLARQWPDDRRRRAADRVVRTGLSRHHAQRTISRILRQMSSPRVAVR